MRLLQALYLREFLKALAVLTLGLSVLLSVLEAVDNLKERPGRDVLLYALLLTPKYIVYTMPLGALFSALLVAGQACRRYETVAVLSAGASLRRLFAPLLVAGLLLSLVGFLLAEFVVPPAGQAALRLKAPTRQSLEHRGSLWLRAQDGSLVRFGLYARGGRAREVSVFRFNARGVLAERLQAQRGLYQRGRWVLRDVQLYHLGSGQYEYRQEVALQGLLEPQVLETELREPEQMGYWELRRYVGRLRQAGLQVQRKLLVDLQARLSVPLANLLMVALALGLALRRAWGALVAAALGVGVSLSYWLLLSLSLSLGYAGVLPVALSAWLAPAALAGAAGWSFLTIPE
jgi:lipopolysaccharide export system permease protein